MRLHDEVINRAKAVRTLAKILKDYLLFLNEHKEYRCSNRLIDNRLKMITLKKLQYERIQSHHSIEWIQPAMRLEISRFLVRVSDI
jgi:hypothetical protein